MLITDKTRFQSKINIIIMLFLLTILFALLAWLSNRYVIEYDWTRNGRHTLSDASRDLLKKMDAPIEVVSYARENPLLRDAIKDFIAKYQRFKSDMTLRFINPDTVPDEVRQLGINMDGEIIIRYQNRTEHVKSDSEQDFTNALQRLLRQKKRWVFFVEGHGERNILGKANHDIGQWGNQLVSHGYQVQPLNLAEIETVPDNADILVIAGPRINYLPGEIDIIMSYIRSGGHLLWLHDPGKMHQLDTLAEMLGVQFYQGIVIDYAGQFIGINDPTIALVTNRLYASHQVTDNFKYTTLYPMAAAIKTITSDIWQAHPIIRTGEHTWVEKNEPEDVVEYDENIDTKGPLTIGISLTRDIEYEDGDELMTKQQRVVVVGDGDFLSNTYLENSGNNELGSRIINWLSNDDELISIPPKIASDTQLTMSSVLLGGIAVIFVFVLPIALLITGISIRVKRRNR